MCIHPGKIGFPPGRYASAGHRWPEPVELGPDPGPMPQDLALLARWMTARVRHAGAGEAETVLADAEREAARSFPADIVVAALRAAMAAM